MAANGNPELILGTGRHPHGGEGGERVEEPGVAERQMGYMERSIFFQMEMYADEDADSVVVKRKKRMARTALAMWKEKVELFNNQDLKKRSEARSIMNEVYNLVSLYSVFVGVVLTAVATSSRMQCEHLWSPVGLSLFAYSMLVVIAFTKFLQIRDIQRMIVHESDARKENLILISKLGSRGYANFDFDRDCRERPCREFRVPFWRSALIFTVSLTVFTAGLVFSLVHILCWSDTDPQS